LERIAIEIPGRPDKKFNVPAEELPADVRLLIAESIDSVPELEAILLLRKDAHRQWTATEAGQRLYVSETVAEYLLGILADRGFFAREGQAYRYAPKTSELDSVVGKLADSYSRALIAVTTAIHSKPSRSVRQFADAFRLRKEN
jgi:hypothetical protein